MFKSIFTKYISAFILITAVSFLMLASLISTMVAGYYTEINMDMLHSSVETIEHILEKRVNDIKEDDLERYIVTHAKEIESYLSAMTKFSEYTSAFICDHNGNILASVGFEGEESLGQIPLEKNIVKTLMDEDYYESQGSLGGIFREKRISCGAAINLEGKMLGAVFACSSTESLDRFKDNTINAIIMTCFWILIAAIIAVYFISEKISSPVKQMSKAAKAFAKGKFDARVPVKGQDEISELAIAFNNMASSLSELENMRSSFLSNVSHDLRTPMTTISGFIDGILDGTIPDDKREYYLRIIGDEVRRLSRLVAALLDVSRIQAGDRKFVFAPFDICEMARIILISFEQKIDKKKLDVEFDTEQENLYVIADYDAIYQILYNICDNAVKFSSEGGKYRIRIIEKDRKVFVSVYNEGVGIKSEELPHVFERFYKSDKSRGLDKSGVGLGLYIAKSIIDAHDEEIWVRSVYGEYCEFVFTLKKATDSQVKKAFQKGEGIK